MHIRFYHNWTSQKRIESNIIKANSSLKYPKKWSIIYKEILNLIQFCKPTATIFLSFIYFLIHPTPCNVYRSETHVCHSSDSVLQVLSHLYLCEVQSSHIELIFVLCLPPAFAIQQVTKHFIKPKFPNPLDAQRESRLTCEWGFLLIHDKS